MGVNQMDIFSQPRGDRGATMEEGEVQMTTDFLSDYHNYFICQKKQLCQVNQNNRTLFGPYYELPTNQVLDCQGLETVFSFTTPGVITFPAQLSMSFKSSRKYGIRLNTTFQKLIIVNFSTGLKGIINHV